MRRAVALTTACSGPTRASGSSPVARSTFTISRAVYVVPPPPILAVSDDSLKPFSAGSARVQEEASSPACQDDGRHRQDHPHRRLAQRGRSRQGRLPAHRYDPFLFNLEDHLNVCASQVSPTPTSSRSPRRSSRRPRASPPRSTPRPRLPPRRLVRPHGSTPRSPSASRASTRTR